MSILSYTDLKAAIVEFTARSDLDAELDTVIQMAEKRMELELRCSALEGFTSVSYVGGRGTLPDDFSAAKAVLFPGRALKYATLDWLTDYYAGTSGNPEWYTLHGDQIIVFPNFTGAFPLYYRKKIKPLTDTNPTNDLLLAHPDIYLHAALFYSAEITHDQDKMSIYGQMLSDDIARISRREKERQGQMEIQFNGGW
jgi:hypothetical protein